MKVPFGLNSMESMEMSSWKSDQPEIQKLFDKALRAELPRTRALKPWEPDRLNERHLAMVLMRAGGALQVTIARVFGVTEGNASVVLNHPDAELLLAHLLAMRATQPDDYEQRLASMQGPALTVLEDILQDDELEPLQKRQTAFDILRINGHGRPKQQMPSVHLHGHQHQHTVKVDAPPEVIDRLASALRESAGIEDLQIYEVGPEASGGAPIPPRLLSSTESPLFEDVGELPISDPQTPPSEEEAA